MNSGRTATGSQQRGIERGALPSAPTKLPAEDYSMLYSITVRIFFDKISKSELRCLTVPILDTVCFAGKGRN
jgi:hypothetical protein